MKCIRCGCTPSEPCEVEPLRSPGRLSADPARAMVQRAERVQGVRKACVLEGDICSRCAPYYRGVTPRQRRELERIVYRWPDAVPLGLAGDGGLIVAVGARSVKVRA